MATPDLKDLQHRVRSAWGGASAALTRAGIPFTVNSGYRSYEQQAALYSDRANNANPVAPPGHSSHETGAALDITFPPSLREQAAQIMAQHGFGQPVTNDPVHWQFGAASVGGAGAANGDLHSLANQVAAKYGIPPGLFASLISTESGWKPDAVSAAGAQGLTQLMPGTARALGIRDSFDPAQSMDGGARYLSQQYQRFGSWPLALAAYNAGPGAVAKAGNQVPSIPETQHYVQQVMGGAGTSTAGGASPTPGNWWDDPIQAAGTRQVLGLAAPPTAPGASPTPGNWWDDPKQVSQVRQALGLGVQEKVLASRETLPAPTPAGANPGAAPAPPAAPAVQAPPVTPSDYATFERNFNILHAVFPHDVGDFISDVSAGIAHAQLTGQPPSPLVAQRLQSMLATKGLAPAQHDAITGLLAAPPVSAPAPPPPVTPPPYISPVGAEALALASPPPSPSPSPSPPSPPADIFVKSEPLDLGSLFAAKLQSAAAPNPAPLVDGMGRIVLPGAPAPAPAPAPIFPAALGSTMGTSQAPTTVSGPLPPALTNGAPNDPVTTRIQQITSQAAGPLATAITAYAQQTGGRSYVKDLVIRYVAAPTPDAKQAVMGEAQSYGIGSDIATLAPLVQAALAPAPAPAPLPLQSPAPSAPAPLAALSLTPQTLTAGGAGSAPALRPTIPSLLPSPNLTPSPVPLTLSS